MRLRPAIAPELSVAHVCLTRLGYPDPDFQAELRHVLEASPAGAQERVPWKDIEADWLMRVGGFPCQVDLQSALSKSMVSRELDALSARREDLYAFTHGLIYLTDFGRLPRMPPRTADGLVDDVDMALACCLEDDDFDLVAELLLTWPYLRASWTPAAAFGFSVLARVENQVGFLPSLSLRADTFSQLDDSERKAYVVTEAYHTVYVMGILSAALLLPGCAPPSSVPVGGSHRAGVAQTLRDLMLVREPKPQWETDLASLPDTQQDSLAPFLASVALRRALRQSDFRRLRAVLAETLDCGLPMTPAIRQAAELLRRLSRPVPRQGIANVHAGVA